MAKLMSVIRACSGMFKLGWCTGFTLFEVHPDHRAAARCARAVDSSWRGCKDAGLCAEKHTFLSVPLSCDPN